MRRFGIHIPHIKDRASSDGLNPELFAGSFSGEASLDGPRGSSCTGEPGYFTGFSPACVQQGIKLRTHLCIRWRVCHLETLVLVVCRVMAQWPDSVLHRVI